MKIFSSEWITKFKTLGLTSSGTPDTNYEYGEDISQGDLLRIINDAGATKVKKIVSDTLIIHQPSIFNNAGSSYITATYDPVADKVAIFFANYVNSRRATAVVGTITGDLISFGSNIVFSTVSGADFKSTYDSVSGQIVVVYANDDTIGTGIAIVAKIAGTSISFGPATEIISAYSTDYACAYDSLNNKTVVSYRRHRVPGDTSQGYVGIAIVGTVSGTSISFGSESQFCDNAPTFPAMVFDPINGKIAILYTDFGTSNSGTAIVGTVDGTSISFGDATVFGSTSNYHNAATYDTVNGKIIVFYVNSSNVGSGVVGTVDGTSISFGTPELFTIRADFIACAYDIKREKVMIAYRKYMAPYNLSFIAGTVSGDTISFGEIKNLENELGVYNNCVYDPVSGKTAVIYDDLTDDDAGKGLLIDLDVNHIKDFYAIAQETGTTSEIKKVALKGDVSLVNTGHAGEHGYIQENGKLDTIETEQKIGTFINENELSLKN